MKYSREQLAIACFMCASLVAAFLIERTWTRNLLQALLSLGLIIYYQNPVTRPGLSRLLRILSWLEVAYIAGVIILITLERTNTFKL